LKSEKKDHDKPYLYNPLKPKKGYKILVNDSTQGFIKYGFILSFYYLLKADQTENLNKFYENSMREIVSLGGDTDTNACIAG